MPFEIRWSKEGRVTDKETPIRKTPRSRSQLTKTTDDGKIELTEKELTQVTAGTGVFLKLGEIKGESADDKHKGEIEAIRRR
jgi:hypothetical protein